MLLGALESILSATRSGRVVWKKVGPESYETTTTPKVTIAFHYPQMGDEATTGADVAVVSFGGVTTTFFSGTEGMAKLQSILRTAFPEWEEHFSLIDHKVDEFVKQIQKL